MINNEFLLCRFTWIMGVGIAISLRSQLRACVKRKQIFISVLRRACILIILGVILNSQHQNDLSQMRLPGVLQRLGLAYFIVASIETCFMEKQTVDQNVSKVPFSQNFNFLIKTVPHSIHY